MVRYSMDQITIKKPNPKVGFITPVHGADNKLGQFLSQDI